VAASAAAVVVAYADAADVVTAAAVFVLQPL
jgi:hypothetical protein